MDKQTIESILGSDYPGWEDFMHDFIVPLFAGANVDDKRGVNVQNSELDNLAERCGISSVRLLAEVDAQIALFNVYDIEVTDRVCLQRNRVTVQQLVRKIVGEGSAFMVFHHKDDRTEWRFSFCQKIAGESSNAKRHTFLLGRGQNLRTVTRNFLDLHATLQTKGLLEDADLIKCFDVEALSKEFFAKYKKFYEKFVDYASTHDLRELYQVEPKRVRDYIKKMMGRLVFLQFLQKKGWLGVSKDQSWGAGDRQFLQNLFQKSTPKQQEKFLDDVLENIFFKALNDPERGGGGLFDTNVRAYGDNGKVKMPYLNGGLFECDGEDKRTCAFPKEYFSNLGDAEHNPGLLDFFGQYNFTIDENDPTEAEVGVDPEMLSCIFENLLEDNKDKGAYYTPKVIVEYMCRQSLTAYLQKDATEAEKGEIAKFVETHDGDSLTTKKLATRIVKKLRTVKICDPAIGSGAFPMGLLRELQFCRTALEDECQSPAEIKKEIIQNNIYGVDIEKGAVDIARLRFWLSLVVDEPTPVALPNLDFKIMQGNSLLESYKGVDLGGLLTGKVLRKKGGGKSVERYTQGELMLGGETASIVISEAMKKYYSATDHRVKKQLMKDIGDQVKGFIKAQLNNSSLNKEIDALGEQNDKFFLWHTWFNDVFAHGGFDIVIGNPPYVEAKKLKHIASTLKPLFRVYSGTADFSVYFLEHGLNIGREGGTLYYITTNKFFNTEYGQPVRRELLQTQIREMLNFEQVEVFEDILVSSVILGILKVEPTEDKFRYQRFYKLKHEEFASTFLATSAFGTYRQSFLTEREWAFANETALLLKRKIESGRVTIGSTETLHVYRGVTTGYNPAFIIDEQVKAELLRKDHKNADVIKKMLQGRNIRKWYYNESDENLLQTGYDLNIEKKYPEIYKHLKSYEQQLSTRSDQGVKWWNLRACCYYGEFERPEKIIWGLTADKWAFALDMKQHFLPSNGYILTSDDLPIRYLLGLLNSKLLCYYFGFIGVMTAGGAYTLKAATIEALPIPTATSAKQKSIIDLVDKILAAKAKDPTADTSAWEDKIDELVFDLYDLTEPERALVR